MNAQTRSNIIKALLHAASVLIAEDEFDSEAVDIANRTSRSRGAVGAKAVTPRVVRSLVKNKSAKILDFGAGKGADHAMSLREDGYDVTAHEFGSNVQPGVHDPDALRNGPYHVVYASNVLNVQSSKAMLRKTLMQIHKALRPGGVFIGNFPMSPRKLQGFTSNDMAAAIEEVFGHPPQYVPKVGAQPKDLGPKGAPKTPVFYVER